MEKNLQTNTLYPFYEINYKTSIDLIKYGFFAKSNRRFFDDRLGVSLGIRVDQDNFTIDNNLFKNFSPRMALSWSISKENRWKLNFATGRYFKIPTYTILGFKNLNNNFIICKLYQDLCMVYILFVLL